MKWFETLIIALVLLPTLAFGIGNETIIDLPNATPNRDSYTDTRTFLQDEDAARYAEMFGPFVYSGGTHATVASCTSAAFATVAYSSAGQRISQAAAAINYSTPGCNCTNPGTDTAWVIASASASNSINNFARISGTDYFVDCTSSARPDLPANSAWLMQVGITNGAIVSVTDLRVLSIFGEAPACAYSTLNAAVAALPAAQTIVVNCRLGVTSNATVAAGTTLLFTGAGSLDIDSGVTVSFASGARLVADAHTIFRGSGTVSFGSGAGLHWIYPEWWGADATGATDSTAAWAKALAVAPFVAPIACTGNYAVSATSPDVALQLTGRGTAIIGTIPRLNQGLEKSCYIDFTGTGTAIAISPMVGDNAVTLQNLIVRDKNDTATIGLDSEGCVACRIQDVTFEGFNTGFNSTGGWYLGEIRRVRFTNYREQAFLCAGTFGCFFNEQLIDISATSQQVSVTTPVEIELGGTTSHGIRLQATVEGVSTVRHITLQDIQGVEAALYTEGGGGTNVVSMTRVSGHVNLFVQGNATDSPSVLVSASAPATVAYGQTANLVLTGYIIPSSAGTGTETALTVNVPGGANQKGFIGIDWSGLNVKNEAVVSIAAPMAVGRYFGDRYHAANTAAPSANQGRGDDLKGGAWKIHDWLWNINTGSGFLSVDSFKNLVAGNPGTWVAKGMWTLAQLAITDTGDLSPSVDGYNVIVITGAGQTLTALDDGTNSKVVIVKAITGNVILDQGSGFALTGSADLTLTPNCSVLLYRDGTLWRQAAPMVCP